MPCANSQPADALAQHSAVRRTADGRGGGRSFPAACLDPAHGFIEKERAAPCARETAFLLSRRPAMPLTPLELSCAALAVFCAALVRGATGFGFSMICIVLLTLLLPPAQIAPVIVLWEIAASAGHLPFVYKEADWKALRHLALGVALGTPLGAYCLASVPAAPMTAAINAVVLVLTGMLFFGCFSSAAAAGPLGRLRGGRAYRADQRRIGQRRAAGILFSYPPFQRGGEPCFAHCFFPVYRRAGRSGVLGLRPDDRPGSWRPAGDVRGLCVAWASGWAALVPARGRGPLPARGAGPALAHKPGGPAAVSAQSRLALRMSIFKVKAASASLLSSLSAAKATFALLRSGGLSAPESACPLRPCGAHCRDQRGPAGSPA